MSYATRCRVGGTVFFDADPAHLSTRCRVGGTVIFSPHNFQSSDRPTVRPSDRRMSYATRCRVGGTVFFGVSTASRQVPTWNWRASPRAGRSLQNLADGFREPGEIKQISGVEVRKIWRDRANFRQVPPNRLEVTSNKLAASSDIQRKPGWHPADRSRLPEVTCWIRSSAERENGGHLLSDRTRPPRDRRSQPISRDPAATQSPVPTKLAGPGRHAIAGPNQSRGTRSPRDRPSQPISWNLAFALLALAAVLAECDSRTIGAASRSRRMGLSRVAVPGVFHDWLPAVLAERGCRAIGGALPCGRPVCRRPAAPPVHETSPPHRHPVASAASPTPLSDLLDYCLIVLFIRNPY